MLVQAVTREGLPRVRTEYDRGGAKWNVREVKTSKNYEFRDEIARETLQVLKMNYHLLKHYQYSVCGDSDCPRCGVAHWI